MPCPFGYTADASGAEASEEEEEGEGMEGREEAILGSRSVPQEANGLTQGAEQVQEVGKQPGKKSKSKHKQPQESQVCACTCVLACGLPK